MVGNVATCGVNLLYYSAYHLDAVHIISERRKDVSIDHGMDSRDFAPGKLSQCSFPGRLSPFLSQQLHCLGHRNVGKPGFLHPGRVRAREISLSGGQDYTVIDPEHLDAAHGGNPCSHLFDHSQIGLAQYVSRNFCPPSR